MNESERVTEMKRENKKEDRHSRIRKADSFQPSGSFADRVMFLQRTIGNQAVERMIRSGTLQTKISIGQPGDKYEQEADRVADAVMQMPEIVSGFHIRRSCPAYEENELKRQPIKEEEDEKLKRQPIKEEDDEKKKLRMQPEEDEEKKLRAKTSSDSIPQIDPNIESHIQSLNGGGQPLPEDSRAFFEPRFGSDFSWVRLHTDVKAAESAQALNAAAFTIGKNIVFAQGRYAPETSSGKTLLAHELTHVVQQMGAKVKKKHRPFSGQQVINSIGSNFKKKLIQRIPAPGRDFGTFKYCGFGITSRIPGFIKDKFTGSFDVDYTTGCSYIWGNAWSSVWELYDSSDRKMDSDTETPYGGYTIKGDKINAGTPGDGRAKWSLWYRITKTQPWLTSDDDAYPYDYITFDVYSLPVRNQNTRLREELGPIIWQDNFTPAEDGASLAYDFSATASRTTSDSQTTTVSGTVGGERSSNLGFEYEGLTGGFASSLSFSATASLSRTHSISVQTSQTLSKRFSQPNLKAGVTYKVVARPLYHIIDGSVDMISERDGVISGSGRTISGGIRIIKGLDIKIEKEGEVEAFVKRRCWSQRNCQGKAYNQKFSHCHNCYNYGSGKSLGEPGDCENC